IFLPRETNSGDQCGGDVSTSDEGVFVCEPENFAVKVVVFDSQTGGEGPSITDAKLVLEKCGQGFSGSGFIIHELSRGCGRKAAVYALFISRFEHEAEASNKAVTERSGVEVPV